MKQVAAGLALCALAAPPLTAQSVHAGEDLETVFDALDRRLFDVGFNTCNLDESASLVAENLEFYHDQGGVTHGRDAFIATMEQNICNGRQTIRRERVDGSFRLERLYEDGTLYGVIQFGSHRFLIVDDTGHAVPTGLAEFAHLWLLNDDGVWELSRVLSYAHRPPE